MKDPEYQANELGFVLQAGDLKLLYDALQFPGGALEVLWGTRKGIQGAEASLLKSKLEMIYSHLFLFSRLLNKALLEENITLFFKFVNYLEMWHIVIKVEFINARLI